MIMKLKRFDMYNSLSVAARRWKRAFIGQARALKVSGSAGRENLKMKGGD